MSHALAALDRFLLFLIGLIALAAGVAVILVWAQVPEATEYSDRLDLAGAASVTGNTWYDVALGAVAVLGVFLGLWLIAANLRRRGFNRVRSSATDKTGSVDVAVARLAGAVDDSIEQFPGVTDVSHRVAMDRSRPTVTWTVTADPNVDVSRLRAELENSETDFRSAVRDMDLDTVYRLHVNAVKQQ